MTRFRLACVLLAAALGFAVAPAGAQSLLDDILPQRGVCTCATIEPPNDCRAALAEPRSLAAAQRSEIRGQCTIDWRSNCAEQYGADRCIQADAIEQMNTDCEDYALQWYSQVAEPQINEIAAQCNAANQSWIQQCETVERPQNCATCDEMGEEIAALERDIADARAWLQVMRSGETLLTPDDEQEIAQRTDEVDRWERDLAEKREGFSLLQGSEFCPRT